MFFPLLPRGDPGDLSPAPCSSPPGPRHPPPPRLCPLSLYPLLSFWVPEDRKPSTGSERVRRKLCCSGPPCRPRSIPAVTAGTGRQRRHGAGGAGCSLEEARELPTQLRGEPLGTKHLCPKQRLGSITAVLGTLPRGSVPSPRTDRDRAGRTDIGARGSSALSCPDSPAAGHPSAAALVLPPAPVLLPIPARARFRSHHGGGRRHQRLPATDGRSRERTAKSRESSTDGKTYHLATPRSALATEAGPARPAENGEGTPGRSGGTPRGPGREEVAGGSVRERGDRG